MAPPLLALLTDFGEDDYFVPSLKAVIAGLNPEVRTVDVTHRVRPFDIAAGGFILQACRPFFPAGTIFLAAVDPGVGGPRRLLLARGRRHLFVAPDNGLLTFAIDAEPATEIREIVDARYFLTARRTTFEARDRMAPVAAWLSLGVPPEAFGPVTESWVRLDVPRPSARQGKVAGTILHADRFGNLITNIPAALLEPLRGPDGSGRLAVVAGGRTIARFVAAYDEGPPRAPFALVNSLGLMEIAVQRGSAAAVLRLGPGAAVAVRTAGER